MPCICAINTENSTCTSRYSELRSCNLRFPCLKNNAQRLTLKRNTHWYDDIDGVQFMHLGIDLFAQHY